ncbi:NB-ARC - like 10 [Theobroma cacao]|nr:NB-ARC - like 10 [Theobroma cacao]
METAGNVVVKCWDNHRSLDQKMIDLKRKLVDLNALKQDVESRKRAELHPRKKLKSQVDVWLGNVERINDEIQNLEQRVAESISISRGFFMEDVLKKIQEVEELLQQGKFDQGLVVDDLTWIGQALSTTNLVGKAAEICMEEIWTCLMDDDIGKIGVWGMGGLGKTTIMKIINNRLSKMTEKFNIVIWITVSKEMNISKIQNGILRAIGEEPREDEDETIRAGKLFEWLNEKGRYVLILDDLWDKLSLEEVGIPKPSNGSKLVVTTRMLDVCRYLGCREIRMPTLPKQDAWSLFLEKVGKDVLNYPDLLPIVESVVEQCAGLPLAIVTVASSMKGITNVHEWRNARNELSRRVRGVTGLDEKYPSEGTKAGEFLGSREDVAAFKKGNEEVRSEGVKEEEGKITKHMFHEAAANDLTALKKDYEEAGAEGLKEEEGKITKHMSHETAANGLLCS